MIVFGNVFREKLDEKSAALIVQTAHSLVPTFAETPIEQILHTLDLIGRAWLPGSRYYQQAFEVLPRELNMSSEMIAYSLDLIRPLVATATLRQRLQSEFDLTKILDDFHEVGKFAGRLRAYPRGVLLHIAAGNVFLGCIDSLLMGLITKNVSILKLSGRNQIFPSLFAQSILEIDQQKIIANKFAILYWPHHQQDVQTIFQQSVDTIIAWGGDEMLQTYGKNLGPNTKLIGYGPKISCQVIGPNSFPGDFEMAQVGKLIATDLALWDQNACASPQNMFVPADSCSQLPKLMDAIGVALDNFPLSRGPMTTDEEVEILKEKARGEYFRLMEKGYEQQGRNYYLYFDPHLSLRPSALNRCLIFQPYQSLDELASMLKNYRYHLQSCGYWANGREKQELLTKLAGAGVKRFTPIGQMLQGITGAPHDGRYGLPELVNLVLDESSPMQWMGDLLEDVALQVPYYQQKSLASVRALSSWPLMNGEKLGQFFSDLLHPHFTQTGRIYASGGTSNQPKYSFYTQSEFDKIASLLAAGFRCQGVSEGMMVANLFTPGNLWSAFSFVERALAFCQTRQLPIGGLTDYPTLIYYLQHFRPTAIFGLPSLLVSYANYCVETKIALEIPQIFYAGEHLNTTAMDFLRKTWQTQRFCSAGHASVDGGVIGYQCLHCLPGEHHLFADEVHLEIINGEGIITSKIRRALPVIRYQTGDHLSWLPQEASCLCGSKDPKYLLHGRIDSLILIWSCKINTKDLEKTLEELQLHCLQKQIHLRQKFEHNQLIEYLEIYLTCSYFDANTFAQRFYENCRDVKSTYSFAQFANWATIHFNAAEKIVKNSRTGKIPLVIDYRRPSSENG